MKTPKETKDINFIPIKKILNNKQNKKPLIKLMRKNGNVCCRCGAVALELVKFKKYSTKRKQFHNHSGIYGINTNGEYVQFTIDHIIPKSKGGKNNKINFQVMCEKCNKKKSNRLINEKRVTFLLQCQKKILKYTQGLCKFIEKLIQEQIKE